VELVLKIFQRVITEAPVGEAPAFNIKGDQVFSVVPGRKEMEAVAVVAIGLLIPAAVAAVDLALRDQTPLHSKVVMEVPEPQIQSRALRLRMLAAVVAESIQNLQVVLVARAAVETEETHRPMRRLARMVLVAVEVAPGRTRVQVAEQVARVLWSLVIQLSVGEGRLRMSAVIQFIRLHQSQRQHWTVLECLQKTQIFLWSQEVEEEEIITVEEVVQAGSLHHLRTH
jgi:hypothetical protein